MSTLLRKLCESDLERLLEWRNSDEVRHYMYNQELVSREDHLRWFSGISKDPTRHPMILEIDGEPSGFVNIGPVRAGGIADWGFYAAPGAPRGTGRKLGGSALKYAFEQMKLHKICGQVIAFNHASQRFHEGLGFRREGVLVDQHFDGRQYHDVVCFGLTLPMWQTRSTEIPYAEQ